MKEAIFCGPFVGELGWEILRFAPFVNWVKKEYPDKVIVVATRGDRADLYHRYADVIVDINPFLDEFNNENPEVYLIQDCFRLTGFDSNSYHNLLGKCLDSVVGEYFVGGKIIPPADTPNYSNKNFYPESEKLYEFNINLKAKAVLFSNIIMDKGTIVVAPRHREGLRRNWGVQNWWELYDLMWDELSDKFNLIICGKSPDCVRDHKERFLHIEDLPGNLLGLSMAAIDDAYLTVGSQSALPNLSRLLKTPVLEFGNEKFKHTVTYNPHKTPVTFIEDHKYEIAPKILMEHIKRIVE